MIHPDEIVARAHRLYPRAVRAFLEGESDFFPYRLAVDLKLPDSHADLVRQVQLLENRSKSSLGYGYSVHRQLRRSRSHGENMFPSAIFIESMDDLLRLVKKSSEFQLLRSNVQLIQQRLPELTPWAICHWKRLLSISDECEQLIQVVEWLQAHPQPDCFPREIPLAISTKLVESHWPVLSNWLDIALPQSAIQFDCHPKDYARRYGFRWVQQHLPIRLLDKSLQKRLSLPFSEFSLPVHELQRLNWHLENVTRLVFVENKINLLTFPEIPDSVAMGGVGNAITMLSEVAWISKLELIYWGDLDIEGFEILARLRGVHPQTKSFLMGITCLDAHRNLAISGNASATSKPSLLTESEGLAFDQCQRHNLRLEQERIPQTFVVEAVRNELRLLG